MRLRTKVIASFAIPVAAVVAIIAAMMWRRKTRNVARCTWPDNDANLEVEPPSHPREDIAGYDINSTENNEEIDKETENGDEDVVNMAEGHEVDDSNEDDVSRDHEITGTTMEDENRPVRTTEELRENCKCSSSTTDSQSTQHDSGIDMKPSFSDFKDLSFGDDTLSEGSVDSAAALSSLTEAPIEVSSGLHSSISCGSCSNDKEICEIEFPQILCGRLIGRKGKNVKVISDLSGAKIRLIPQSPGEVSTHRIISLTGDSSQIKSALNAIHDKFPTVPLTRINLSVSQTPIQTNSTQFVTTVATTPAPYVQTVLPAMVNFGVVVTSVMDASHFFIQLHNDVVQRQLQQLHQTMLQCYGQGVGPLVLPLLQPILVGTYCAAPAYTYNGWYRAQVLGSTGNPDEVEVRYLDYGGYGRIAASSLRQLRADFLNCLPFQAVECYLASVAPIHGDTFSTVASAVLEDLTMNAVLTARVVGQQNQLPCLELYLMQGQQTIMVNRELVDKGLARWVES